MGHLTSSHASVLCLLSGVSCWPAGPALLTSDLSRCLASHAGKLVGVGDEGTKWFPRLLRTKPLLICSEELVDPNMSSMLSSDPSHRNKIDHFLIDNKLQDSIEKVSITLKAFRSVFLLLP